MHVPRTHLQEFFCSSKLTFKVLYKCALSYRWVADFPSAVPFFSQNNFITEEITYASGRSLRVMQIPRNLEKTAFYSTLCAQRTEAFHIFDLDWLLESHQLWEKNMPNIRPYYGEREMCHACCVLYHVACVCRERICCRFL